MLELLFHILSWYMVDGAILLLAKVKKWPILDAVDVTWKGLFLATLKDGKNFDWKDHLR